MSTCRTLVRLALEWVECGSAIMENLTDGSAPAVTGTGADRMEIRHYFGGMHLHFEEIPRRCARILKVEVSSHEQVRLRLLTRTIGKTNHLGQGRRIASWAPSPSRSFFLPARCKSGINLVLDTGL
jgi:hypothetical protein